MKKKCCPCVFTDDNDDDDELCQVLVRQELYRKHGYAIQADEEQLRTKLEAIYSELSAPMQFKVSSILNYLLFVKLFVLSGNWTKLSDMLRAQFADLMRDTEHDTRKYEVLGTFCEHVTAKQSCSRLSFDYYKNLSQVPLFK